MKTSIVAVVAVVAVALVGIGFVFLGGSSPTGTTTSPSTTSTTTTATSQSHAPPPGVLTAFDTHLSRITSRDIPTVLTDYQDSATVVWAGSAGGEEGTYSGSGNIRLLYSAALSSASQLTVTPSDIVQVNKSSSQVVVNSTLGLKGVSSYIGNFNGTVAASITYVYVNGAWLISHEYWNYKSLQGSSSGPVTTFPQWQKAGATNPTRRSPDWLHNFAWDYGGPGVAIFVWTFVTVIAVTVVLKRARKPSGLEYRA